MTCIIGYYILTGLVEETENDFLTIRFMARSGTKFIWPEKADIQTLPRNEILCVLDNEPEPYSSSSRYFIISNTHVIDKLMADLK